MERSSAWRNQGNAADEVATELPLTGDQELAAQRGRQRGQQVHRAPRPPGNFKGASGVAFLEMKGNRVVAGWGYCLWDQEESFDHPSISFFFLFLKQEWVLIYYTSEDVLSGGCTRKQPGSHRAYILLKRQQIQISTKERGTEKWSHTDGTRREHLWKATRTVATALTR